MFDTEAEFKRRLPAFYARYPFVSRCLISFGRFIWQEKAFQDFGIKHRDKNAIELIDAGFREINFDFVVDEKQLDYIPLTGRLIIVANHPFFALDGLGLLKYVSKKRKDLKIMVGGSFPVFAQHAIVIDDTLKTLPKDIMVAMHEHLENEGVLIIFPSGQLSQFINGKIQDPPWHSSFFKLALRKNVPVLPVFIEGRNSSLFYFFAIVWMNFARVLALPQLFHQRNKRPRMIFGDLIDVHDIDKHYATSEEKVNAIRDIVYALDKVLPGISEGRLEKSDAKSR